MFTGLSAFPLTPLDEHGIDEAALGRLVQRAAAAGVDSFGVLGSTGSYAYLGREERRRVLDTAVAHAGATPVLAGIGALRTRDVLAHAADAQEAGAAAVLLAPVSYQPLTPEEVYGLYEDAAAELSVPLVVYDNPRTTGFAFTDELHAAIATLPGVASVKIPPVPADPDAAAARLGALRALLPDTVTIGISGDACAATALAHGADAWCSVLAGILPEVCVALTRAALRGPGRPSGAAGADDADPARALSARLAPVWDLFAEHGSLRVAAAAAEVLGLTASPSLPRPLRPLDAEARAAVVRALEAVGPS
ncbi:Dihydrodipicolinate synthetase family protein [Sinomonas atrocyanea]|uniref:Dihydrodipicolinate synthetase family protein n=1 Tax=Sinomonas atrocyanea TaxID=37927 RepID=A0A126ZXS6_9MICC|nr:dihydrodipicolinate synthase family protein [Sinomonas atrocyanea]AMM31903.1 Dihydrodipicolinate synthetase family protein [Sinomonas atrocyanea]GEB65986.1 dihydrodipicolinate synthase family protein [Sinomonas atrocyanea]